MKLKRIIAGITACTIVGSTMLTMPISAKTTTKAENVSLSDLLNTAKMAVNLKDDLTAEKQAEILDKFDTNGNGQISIGELLAVAQRVARTDESDIVNEYGTADSEETTETTETTEETTTTEEVTFNPTLTIGGKEYKDGDIFIAKANEIYEIGVSDAENEITVSLTGSKDDNNNDLVRVSENRFTAVKDGTLTITVKTTDGQEKTITLNVVTEKALEDIDVNTLYISYLYEGENYYSDDYKKFSNEIGKNIFNNEEIIEDSEQYWEDKAQDFSHEKISGGTICTGIGGKVEIKGLAIGNDNRRLIRGAVSQNSYEDYNTSDKVTYISTDTNKVTIDENGVITGLVSGTVEIIVMVNGKEYSRFNVYVGSDIYSIIETSDEKYAFDYYHSNYPYQYTLLTEGKYVENASQGKALSLKDLQNQVGAENVKSVSVKNFDGTEREIAKVKDENGVMYYADTTTSTVYYAITSETGEGSLKVDIENGMSVDVRVLDMEQYKNYQAILPESLIFEFRDRKVVATAENNNIRAGYYHLTEGETFNLSDIVKVNGIDDPKITVTNSQDGTTAQNLDYDPLTKTFTARELTEENSGFNNLEMITFTYKATDGTTRTIKFTVSVCKPIVAFNPAELGYDADPNIFDTAEENFADMNGGKIYIQKDMNQYNLMELVKKSIALSVSIDKNGVYQQYLESSGGVLLVNVEVNTWGKFIIDNEKMFKVNEISANRNTIEWVDRYKLTTGDTATITVTEMMSNPNLKASFTIEVVDELPKAVKTGIGTDKFKYPKDNKANQFITFDNIVDVNNLPDGCTLVPYVESASENVGYIDEKGEKQQTSSNTMRVDTTGIKIIQGTNGHYSISGIEVAGASKVDTDTFMNVKVKVLDGKGNTITISDPMKLSVNGEKGFAMTINGNTQTIRAGETTDFGTICIPEGKTINFSASETSDTLSVSETDNVTIDKDKGTITAKTLKEISQDNAEGKEITFTYGKGLSARTAKAKIVVVRPLAVAKAYDGDSYINVTDDVYFTADRTKKEAVPAFATKVDTDDKPILSEGLITEGFTLSDTKLENSVETSLWKQQGIEVTVKNVETDPETLVTTNITKTEIVFPYGASELTFENPWTVNLPDGWKLKVTPTKTTEDVSECDVSDDKIKLTRTRTNEDISEANISMLFEDKNGNRVKSESQTLIAYATPNDIIDTKYAINEDKEFCYKIIYAGVWSVSDVELTDKEANYTATVDENGIIHIEYNKKIKDETDVTLNLILKKGNVTITQKHTFTTDPFYAKAHTEYIDVDKKVVKIRCEFRHGSFDRVKVPEGAGYRASIENNDNIQRMVTLEFDNITDYSNAKFTLISGGSPEAKITIDELEFVPFPNISYYDIKNVGNRVFTYEVEEVENWEIISATSETEDYEAKYANGILTVTFKDAIINNTPAPRIKFKLNRNRVTDAYKIIEMPLTQVITFPTIKLAEETATADDNKTFKYKMDDATVSALTENGYSWNIAKSDSETGYELSLENGYLVVTFTDEIQADEKDKQIKFTLTSSQKSETYVSNEQTLTVTANIRTQA